MKAYGLFILFVSLFVFASKAQNKVKLQFDDSGHFKIVQFTDTHIDPENNQNIQVYEILKTVLEIEKPHLAIFTGDIMTKRNPQKGYDKLTEIFKEAKIPWAVVFGNHESESNT